MARHLLDLILFGLTAFVLYVVAVLLHWRRLLLLFFSPCFPFYDYLLIFLRHLSLKENLCEEKK